MEALKGAAVSAAIKEQVQNRLAELDGYIPTLAIIRVGEKPDDISYEKGAMKKMASFGLNVQSYTFPENISDALFKEEFAKINADKAIDGILMLRPLPKHICEKDIEKMIDPASEYCMP